MTLQREGIQDLLDRIEELETAVKDALANLDFYAKHTNHHKFRNAVAILERAAASHDVGDRPDDTARPHAWSPEAAELFKDSLHDYEPEPDDPPAALDDPRFYTIGPA